MTSTNGAALVEVTDVVKTFSEGGVETRVLRGANLTLFRHETTSLIGPSGTGKSTLVGLIGGLMNPDSGHVAFDGRDLAKLDDSERCRLRGRRIGVVMQNGNIVPFLTARENVEVALELSGRGCRGRSADTLLEELGLGHRLDHLPVRLSGGEAQRVALAMALAREPDLLLADEVTGELDSTTAAQVMDAIFEASHERGLTVMFVTHQRELAASATHQLRLADGVVQPA